MVSGPEVDKLTELIRDTVTLLCKNGIRFKSKFSIDGLLRVTVDDSDVFLVNIVETVSSPEPGPVEHKLQQVVEAQKKISEELYGHVSEQEQQLWQSFGYTKHLPDKQSEENMDSGESMSQHEGQRKVSISSHLQSGLQCSPEPVQSSSASLSVSPDGCKSPPCNVCGKSFSSMYSYKRHINIHKGIYPANCTLCGKGFGSTNQLRSHMFKIHTGVTEFKCEQCGREFGYKHHLKGHLPRCTKKLLSVSGSLLHVSEHLQHESEHHENEQLQNESEHYDDEDESNEGLDSNFEGLS